MSLPNFDPRIEDDGSRTGDHLYPLVATLTDTIIIEIAETDTGQGESKWYSIQYCRTWHLEFLRGLQDTLALFST